MSLSTFKDVNANLRPSAEELFFAFGLLLLVWFVKGLRQISSPGPMNESSMLSKQA